MKREDIEKVLRVKIQIFPIEKIVFETNTNITCRKDSV
jgi:hypothetical protein